MTWNSDLIIPGTEYGNPRQQVRANQARSNAYRPEPYTHGMTGSEVRDFNSRMSAMMPQIATADASMGLRGMFEGDLPRGATWSPQRTAQYMTGTPGSTGLAGGGASGGRSMQTMQQPLRLLQI